MNLDTIIIILVAAFIIYKQMQAYDKLTNEIQLLRLNQNGNKLVDKTKTTESVDKTDIAPDKTDIAPEPMTSKSSVSSPVDSVKDALTFMMNIVNKA